MHNMKPLHGDINHWKHSDDQISESQHRKLGVLFIRYLMRSGCRIKYIHLLLHSIGTSISLCKFYISTGLSRQIVILMTPSSLPSYPRNYLKVIRQIRLFLEEIAVMTVFQLLSSLTQNTSRWVSHYSDWLNYVFQSFFTPALSC